VSRFLQVMTSLFLMIMLASAPALSEEYPDARYKIEVITVDPGAELFMRWGHIAIVVVDQEEQSRLVYNFGTFDFTDPSIRFRYAMGHLNYWLSIVPFMPMIHYYRAEGRGIVSHVLNLTPDEAEAVAEKLAINALPENRTYAYRHYLDNCCTRIRDVLDDVLGGALKQEFDTGPTDKTYRYYTIRALTGLPLMRNVILFILGQPIDRPISRWEAQFLPEVFGEDLDRVTLEPGGRPLLSQRRVYFEQIGPKVGEKAEGWEYLVMAGFGALLFLGLGLPILFRKKGWSWTGRAAGLGLFCWGFLAGFGGLLVVLLWSATAHYDCHDNENVLVFPMLHLWLMGPGAWLLFKGTITSKTNRILRYYLIAALGLLGINLILKVGPFFQQNYQFIFFAALMNIGSIIALSSLGEKTSAPGSGSSPKTQSGDEAAQSDTHDGTTTADI
jgi:hypothetical protein